MRWSRLDRVVFSRCYDYLGTRTMVIKRGRQKLFQKIYWDFQKTFSECLCPKQAGACSPLYVSFAKFQFWPVLLCFYLTMNQNEKGKFSLWLFPWRFCYYKEDKFDWSCRCEQINWCCKQIFLCRDLNVVCARNFT